MNNNVKCLLAFTFGTVVGVAASWKFMELKYRKIADEEIASVKEVYSSKPVEEDTEEADEDQVESEVTEEPEPEFIKEDHNEYHNEYHKILQTQNYHNNYSAISKEGDTSDESLVDGPYIIDYNEVGELDYETIELTYYEGDHVLADELDELVDDVDGTVGKANLEKFGEYDSIYVRHDARRVDYEILLDIRSFSEATYLKKYEY